MPWCKSLLVVLCLLAVLRTVVRGESPSKPLFIVLIGGFDSEPTADQIANKAPRGVGNSGDAAIHKDIHARLLTVAGDAAPE